ncbi:MAG: transaldolase family protein, partial [Ferruginibacter sp.]
KDTINTLPMETIDAFRDHGSPEILIGEDLQGSKNDLEKLKANNISLDDITQKLEEEGVQKFNDAYAKLLKAVETKAK